MTNDEMQMIDDLAQQLKLMSNEKSYQADQHIQQMIAPIENALYKLVQVVLIQDLAIQKLKGQSYQQPTNAPKSFLGNLKDKLFGNINAAEMPRANNTASSSFNAYSPSPAPAPYPYSAPSFLSEALTIGGGVAGGMLLGNALENLFDGNSSHNQPTEIIENNYYESDSRQADFSDKSTDFSGDNDFDAGSYDSTDYDSGSDYSASDSGD